MGKGIVTYPSELRKTDTGKRLYALWIKIRMHEHVAEFAHFPDFYDWAINNGYSEDAMMYRLDDEKPYSPENCVWRTAVARNRPFTPAELAWIDAWNKAVNRLRVYFGMDPFQPEADKDSGKDNADGL